MREFTAAEMAQADACDREKVRDYYPWMTSTRGDRSQDGRMLESDPMYKTLNEAKKRIGNE